MHKGLICTLIVLPLHADGGNGHAADGGQHKYRADHHNKRLCEIDCPQRIRSNTPTDKDTIHDGEQKESALAQNGGEDIFQNQFCSGLFHL